MERGEGGEEVRREETREERKQWEGRGTLERIQIKKESKIKEIFLFLDVQEHPQPLGEQLPRAVERSICNIMWPFFTKNLSPTNI